MTSDPDSQKGEPSPLTLELDDDGIALLTFDRPDSKVNLLTTPVMEQLDGLLGELEEHAAANRVRAVVVRSAKEGNFIAGADIEEILGIADPEEGRSKAARGQEVFRRLEELPIPSLAAIDGTCLGGGTELALACSHRLAADRDETEIGLPEVRLGILPGFGGTVRLPRLIGLQAALDLLLTGKNYSARKAERVGLVDERVPPSMLERRAREVVLQAAEELGGAPDRKRGFFTRMLEDTAPGRRLILRQARKKVLERTGGHYPAPLTIIDTVRETMNAPLDRAFAVEAEALGRLIVTRVSKNLVHVFRLMEGAGKKMPGADPRPVGKIAVLGAGVMGGGIAQLAAYRGIPVRLKDIRAEANAQGLQTARDLFEKAVDRRKMERREADEAMRRIAPTLDYSGFGAVDLVVEAVVENMEVKRQVLAEAESNVDPDCVLASNTSTLSITEMQHGVEDPGRVCGMHFFNPVHKMPLIEVIRGAGTSEKTVATVFDAARKLGKTPLVVEDGPGFLVNRLLAPYLNEAGWLLTEGSGIERVDQALLDFGMPMGPFRLLDEVGLDIAIHASSVLHEAFGDRMRPSPPLAALKRTERLGRKGGSGFYSYQDGEAKSPDATIYSELDGTVPMDRMAAPPEEIVNRCILVMVNEAARILEDGVVAGADDVDLGMITGTGFPPFRGGLLRYADDAGLSTILARLEALERAQGARFSPAPLIRRLVENDRTFYQPADPGAGAK